MVFQNHKVRGERKRCWLVRNLFLCTPASTTGVMHYVRKLGCTAFARLVHFRVFSINFPPFAFIFINICCTCGRMGDELKPNRTTTAQPFFPLVEVLRLKWDSTTQNLPKVCTYGLFHEMTRNAGNRVIPQPNSSGHTRWNLGECHYLWRNLWILSSFLKKCFQRFSLQKGYDIRNKHLKWSLCVRLDEILRNSSTVCLL